MHDFHNRTPGTAYGDYGTWAADGGPKQSGGFAKNRGTATRSSRKNRGTEPRDSGKPTDWRLIAYMAVIVPFAFYMPFLLKSLGLLKDSNSDLVVTAGAFIASALLVGFFSAAVLPIICVATAYCVAWIVFKSQTAGLLTAVAVFVAVAGYWSPVVWLASKRPAVALSMKIAKIAGPVALVAVVGWLAYTTMGLAIGQ